MRRFFGSLLAACALVLAGCGEKPRIPAGTEAAAYADLTRAAWRTLRVADDVSDALPPAWSELLGQRLRHLIDLYRTEYSRFDLDWIVLTVNGGNVSGALEAGAVLKCAYAAKGEGPDLEARLRAFSQEAEAYGIVYAFVNGRYVIAATSEAYLKRLVALYRDGEGAVSGEFGDLTDLSGDSVARLKVVGSESLAENVLREERVSRFCGDSIWTSAAVAALAAKTSVLVDFNLSKANAGVTVSVGACPREVVKGACERLGL